MTARNYVLRFALVALLAAPYACKKQDEVAQEKAAPGADMTNPQMLQVTSVDLGKSIGGDKRVNDNATTDDFAPNETIYASVATEGTGENATLTARWTYQDGQVVDETSQTISPTGPSITEFHISKPDGFPKGDYKVEILLNGQSVQSKDFEVK